MSLSREDVMLAEVRGRVRVYIDCFLASKGLSGSYPTVGDIVIGYCESGFDGPISEFVANPAQAANTVTKVLGYFTHEHNERIKSCLDNLPCSPESLDILISALGDPLII